MISKLRKKYPRFIYQNYTWDIKEKDIKISFDFKIEPDIYFNPKIKIQGIGDLKIQEDVLNNLVFNLGLIEMISYWKVVCSPIIQIEAGILNKEQIKWWKELIINGMGQFFYENKINWKKDSFLKIETNQSKETFKVSSQKLKDKVLIPVGGGKDSIVTLELFKNKNISCFALNPNKTIKKIIKIKNCKDFIITKRKIDSKLLELNRKGFLNGHTPFSAYLAFLNVLIAAISDKKYIVLSNERSSNEGNLNYLGKEINHQYSKSFDFEKSFRKYSKKYLVKNIEYFSFLRPLYEIQITKLFSKHKKYFKDFLSCNEAYKTKSCTIKTTGKWCGKCSKCLFVFICLYPFVEEKEIVKIFGKNLLKEKTSLPIIKELMGVESHFKPFECVGTIEESLIATYLCWKKEKDSLITKYFEKNILPQHKDLDKKTSKIINAWNNQNSVPDKFIKILKNEIRKSKK